MPRMPGRHWAKCSLEDLPCPSLFVAVDKEIFRSFLPVSFQLTVMGLRIWNGNTRFLDSFVPF